MLFDTNDPDSINEAWKRALRNGDVVLSARGFGKTNAMAEILEEMKNFVPQSVDPASIPLDSMSGGPGPSDLQFPVGANQNGAPSPVTPPLAQVIILAGDIGSGRRCAQHSMQKMGLNFASQYMVVTSTEDIRRLYGTRAKLKLWRCVTFFNGKSDEERYRVEKELERWVDDADDMGFLCD